MASIQVVLNESYVKLVESAPKFGMCDKIGYMLGDLGFNSLQTLVNSYFMLFCVNLLGVEPAHFALIIFVCRALDACNDTFIGITVDRRAGDGRGKMRPWIKWFAIPYFLMTIAMFLDVAAFPYVARIIWLFGIYFIWAIVGTFINVPYGAMSNVITTNLFERTELSNFRSIGSTVANIGTTTIVPLLLFDAEKNPIASRFILLSITLGIFCTICLFLAHRLISERIVVPTASQKGEKINYLQVIKSFGKNRVLLAVVATYIIAKLFTQPVSTMNQYVFMVYFQDTAMLSFASLSTLAPMIVGMLLLKPLVKRFGKKNLVTWPLLGAAVSYLCTALLPMTPVSWVACQLFAAFCTIFCSLLLWSLISDAVDYQAYLTHQHNEATVYAVVTFVVFFAGSASTSIIALLLDFVGYDAAAGSLNQLPGVAEHIKMLVGIWPALGACFSFVAMKFIYNLTDDEMAKVSASLAAESKAEEIATDIASGASTGDSLRNSRGTIEGCEGNERADA